MDRYYHISMNALDKGLIFKSKEDFRYGVNTIALVKQKYPVRILCYCLMNNHMHILLAGSYDDCNNYFVTIVRRLVRRFPDLPLSYGGKQIVPIADLRQLRNVIVYILRNPLKAKIDSPMEYPWSSADVFNHHGNHLPDVRKIGDLKYREYRKLFHTHSLLPDSYEYVDGMILNSSFVDYQTVVSKFNGNIDFFYMLHRDSTEQEVEVDSGIASRIEYSDRDILVRMKDILRRNFNVDSMESLGSEDLLSLAAILRKKFFINASQMSRILGIDKTIAEKLY